jgi:hypothetical protein
MQLLEPVEKHRAVVFFQNVPPDVHSAVAIDSQNVGVIGSMVNLAE